MKALENKQTFSNLSLERVCFLDSLRAFAIIMVVGLHTLGYCNNIPVDFKEILTFIMQTAAVPIFFLVDGFLFARSVMHSTYNYSVYIRKSLFRLLFPWIAFTLFYTSTRYVFELAGFFKEGLITGHSWKEVAVSAYGSVYASQMYFLFSLFLIRSCSPLLKRFVLVKKSFTLLLLFFFYYTAYKITIPSIHPILKVDGGQEPILHALWGVQFYLLGIICFKTSRMFTFKKTFITFLLLFIFALLIQDKFGHYAFDIIQYLYLLTVFLFFTLYQQEFCFFNMIGKHTMGIYLVHASLVLRGVSIVVNKFVSHPITSFLLIILSTFIVTVCIVIIIYRIPYGKLLFGTPYQRNV